ncbi:zona pellucida sperm-binding protein 3-like [Chiloscyllium plagiosum]|uniref:zona pellucida sperm-binding protein 3-like n=1 Tax=Chiloscyllium plagiosum TaxID=36176 RepID=UPI001CB877D9|nr:zona pellucida sperm-binding protein 3-like [Chiloscyllium plagiosum]
MVELFGIMSDFVMRGLFPVLMLVGAVCCSDTWQQFLNQRFPWGIERASPVPERVPSHGGSRFPVSEGVSLSPLQTVMVQCGEHNLLVKAQLDLFGTGHLIKAADLTLGTVGCQLTRVYPENHTVLFDYGLHECGSRLQITGDFLIYTTHLTHTPNYPGSVIVRTNGAVVPIECRYLRKGNVSSNPINPTWIPFSSTRSGEGHLSFCLLDSIAEDSFSTFVLPGDGRELDKLRFDLDAFRFYGDEHSLIFITCHLKVAAVDQGDSRNKACTFQKLQNIWTPLEESDSDICACCHVGNCGSTREILFPSRGRRDLGPEAENEAGFKWEGEASLGPLIILDTRVTNLATEPLPEVEVRIQERSPGVELVVLVTLTVTVVCLISASLLALVLYRKHKRTPINL